MTRTPLGVAHPHILPPIRAVRASRDARPETPSHRSQDVGAMTGAHMIGPKVSVSTHYNSVRTGILSSPRICTLSIRNFVVAKDLHPILHPM
jgi:hypothetical protein